MSGCGVKNTISELVLAAVFYLQQKNGVSVMEIAEYVGEKRCCDPCKIRGVIKIALTKAKEHGIMSESKGRYRIEGKYEDKLDKEELKPKKTEEDDDDDGNGKNNGNDLCAATDHDGHRQGENQGEGDKFEDCKDGAEEEEEDEECEDEEDEECNDGERGEPMPKKRKMYSKMKYNVDSAEEEDDDED